MERRPTTRRVSARLELDVSETADMVLAVAVTRAYEAVDETVSIHRDGTPLEAREIAAAHGGRLHELRDVAPGAVTVEYAATVGAAAPLQVGDEEWFQYIRPSRYCESDRLGPVAQQEFDGVSGVELVHAVVRWVHGHIAYVSGSSRPTDGAVNTYLSRSGVCRDFAHLAVTFLRANGIPARVVSVYAPGLDPMDFHAVVEACVEDTWVVVDPTGLAPRPAMVRVATGADAADIAFLTNVRGAVELSDMTVSAVAEPSLPTDDGSALVQLQ